MEPSRKPSIHSIRTSVRLTNASAPIQEVTIQATRPLEGPAFVMRRLVESCCPRRKIETYRIQCNNSRNDPALPVSVERWKVSLPFELWGRRILRWIRCVSSTECHGSVMICPTSSFGESQGTHYPSCSCFHLLLRQEVPNPIVLVFQPCLLRYRLVMAWTEL